MMAGFEWRVPAHAAPHLKRARARWRAADGRAGRAPRGGGGRLRAGAAQSPSAVVAKSALRSERGIKFYNPALSPGTASARTIDVQPRLLTCAQRRRSGPATRPRRAALFRRRRRARGKFPRQRNPAVTPAAAALQWTQRGHARRVAHAMRCKARALLGRRPHIKPALAHVNQPVSDCVLARARRDHAREALCGGANPWRARARAASPRWLGAAAGRSEQAASLRAPTACARANNRLARAR